jgi:hypothetical protein
LKKPSQAYKHRFPPILQLSRSILNKISLKIKIYTHNMTLIFYFLKIKDTQYLSVFLFTLLFVILMFILCYSYSSLMHQHGQVPHILSQSGFFTVAAVNLMDDGGRSPLVVGMEAFRLVVDQLVGHLVGDRLVGGHLDVGGIEPTVPPCIRVNS